jgi:hypothetical protein
MLTKETAYMSFDKVIKEIPPQHRGSRVDGLVHTPWQIMEHLRLAQWDILEFSCDPNHESPPWPEGYWPDRDTPPSDDAWEKSVADFKADTKQLCNLISDVKNDLNAPFPHGDGQTLLREAILTIQHNAYHIGQLAMMRKGFK